MSDREPKDWQRKLKEERHVHFVDIMDESRRAPPFDHFPITPSRRGGPIRRLLLKVIPCYSDREVKYLYEEKVAEPQMKETIGEDHKKGKNNRKNGKEYKNIKTKEDSKITKVKTEYEKKVKDVTKNEKESTAHIRRSKNSSTLGPSTSAEGRTPQRKPKADRHGKRAQKTRSSSQRRSVLPSGKWRPLPPLPKKLSRKPKTALQEDSQQASNKVEKQEKSPQLSGVRSPRYPPTAARERRRNSSEFLWRQMRYQQQKIGFILRDKAKERRQKLAKANLKNGTCHDGVMTNHVAQPMAQVESRMSSVVATYQTNQNSYPPRDEILNHIAQTCSQSAQETKRSIELLERNACAQNDMLITISQILGQQMTRSVLSAEYILQQKELLPQAADMDVISNSSYGPSTSSTQDSNTDELSDWEDLSSISSESVSVQTNYSMRRKSTRKTTEKTHSRHAKAQKTTDLRKSLLVTQNSDYSESSSNDDTCRSVPGQSEIELFPKTQRSTTTGKDKKHTKRKSKQQLTKMHEKLSEDVSRTPAMQVISDISDTDSNLNDDDTYPSEKKENTPDPRDMRTIKGRQRNVKPSRTMTVETPSSESAEFNLQTLNLDASPDDVADKRVLQQQRTPQFNNWNVSEDDTPVHSVLHSPESAESNFSSDPAKKRGHRRKRHSAQPGRLQDMPERAHPPTSIGDEGCTTSDKSVSGRKRRSHKYKKSKETKCLALSDDEEPEELEVNLSAAPSAPESTVPSMKEETLCSKSSRKRKKQTKMKRSSEPTVSSLKSENLDYSENKCLSPIRTLWSTPTMDEAVFSDMPMKTRNTHPRMTKQYKEIEAAPPSSSEDPKVSTLLAASALTEDNISNKPLRRSKRNTNSYRKSVLPTNDHDDHQAHEASLTTQTPVHEISTVPNSSKEDLQIHSDHEELNNWSDSDTAKGIGMSTKKQNIEIQLKLKKRMREKRDKQLLSQKPEMPLENLSDNDLSEKQTNFTTTQKTSSNPPGIKSRRKEREVLDQDDILSSSPDMVQKRKRKRKEQRKTQKGETLVTVDRINNNEVLQESQGRLEYVALNREIREQRSHSPPEDEDSISDDDCGYMSSVFPVKNTDTVYHSNDNPSKTEQNDYEVSDVSNLATGDNEIQGNEIASPSKASKENIEKRDKKSKKLISSSVWKKIQHKSILQKNKLRKHSTDLDKTSAKSEAKRDSDDQVTNTDAEAKREIFRDVERQGKEEEQTNLQPSEKSITSKHKETHKKRKTPKMLKKIAKQQGLFKKNKNQQLLTSSNDTEKPLPEEEISKRFQDRSFETKTNSDHCQETGPERAKKNHKKRKASKALKKIAKQQGLFKNKKSQKPIEPSSGPEKSKTDDELHSPDAEKSSPKSNNLCQATTLSPMEDDMKSTSVDKDRKTERDHETSDVNGPLQHRKSMSKWKKFKHDQGLYRKQKNRFVKTSGEREETSNEGYAALGGVKKENNSGSKELTKLKEKDTRKRKEDEKRVKRDLKKTKKQKDVLADGSTRDLNQSPASSSHGKKSKNKLSNLLRGKDDHTSRISQIAPQSSEIKENEIPFGLASCRNGVPTAVTPNIELLVREAERESNLMNANLTSYNTRPTKPATAADMSKDAEVTVGWCDPTKNKLTLSNDVTDKTNEDLGRIKRRHGDTDSGVGRFHPLEGNDVSDKGCDSPTISTERNREHQGDLPARFDNSLPHDEQYKLPVNKQNSTERKEDCTVSGQSQQRWQIMNQILHELDDNSSQSNREQDALIVSTSLRKVTETKTNQSDSSCIDDIIDGMTSPIPAQQVKLLPQAQRQVKESDDDVIPNLQRHQPKTEDSSNPVIKVTDVVEDIEKCESFDDMIDQKPPASRADKDNNVENSEHKLNYNSWDEVTSEEETADHIKQGNSSMGPRSPDVELLDELLDELSPSNKKHVTIRQADNKLKQMAGTDFPMEERKGFNVNAADLVSADKSLTQNAEKAPEDQSCVTELDVIEQMLSTSTGKDDFDIFKIVDRMPQSKTKPEMLTTHPEKFSHVQTSEDNSTHSDQPIFTVISDNKCTDDSLHGENKVKQCHSSGNIKENTLPKAESEVSQNSKPPSYAPREEQIDKHPIPRDEDSRSSLVTIESQKPVNEKPIETETHTTMSTQERQPAGGKISINPAWGSSLDDFISSSTRSQDVSVGSDIPGEVEMKSPTHLNTTDDVTHDVPSSPSTKSDIYTDKDSSAHSDKTQPITSKIKEENTGKTNFLDYLTQMRLEESLKKAGKPETISPFENSDVPSYLRTDFNPAPDQKPFKRWDPVAAQTKMEKICRPKNKSKEPSEPRWLKEDFNPAPEQKPFKKWNPDAAQKTMEKISAKKITTEQPEPRWLRNDFNPAPELKLSKRWDPSAAQKKMEHGFIPQSKKKPAGSEPRWLQSDFNPAPECKPIKRWDLSVAQNKLEKIGLSKKNSPEHTVTPRWLQKDFNPVENGRKTEDWKVPGAKSDVLSSTPESQNSTAGYWGWETPDSSMSLDDKVQGREAIKKESQKILDSMRSQEMFHSLEKESSTKSIPSTSAEVDKDIPRFLRADFNPAPEQKPFKRWNDVEAKKKLAKIGDSKEKFPNNSKDEKPPWLKSDFIPTRKEAKRGSSNQKKTHEADLIHSATKETAKDASSATPRWLQPYFDPAAKATRVSELNKGTSYNMPPAAQFQHSVLGQPTNQPDTDMFDIQSDAVYDENRYQPRFVRDIYGQYTDPALRERSLPVDNSPQWMQPGFHGVPDQPRHAPASPPDALQSQVQALDKSSKVPAWLHSKPQPLPETSRNMPKLPGVSSMSKQPTHQHDMDNRQTDGRVGRRTFKQFAPRRQADGSSLPTRSIDVISSETEYEDPYPSGMGKSEIPRPSWITPGLIPTGNARQDSAAERRILLNSISKTQARFTNRI